MESKVLLIYGEVLPPYHHIEKIIKKYYQHYRKDKDMNKEFQDDSYYEVWIEERYTGVCERKKRNYIPTVPVKKEFLARFINIFRALKGNIYLCNTKHEHPIVEIQGTEYEGYCFYLDNGTEKVIFYDTHWMTVEANEDTEKILRQLISS
ncbi:MAG TPA: hypothetical protein VE710_07890 [Candidatus Bathyarchaeia archaeon]|nr:hypothetical protein [Candidatus Bathyarchaeia archaeon]